VKKSCPQAIGQQNFWGTTTKTGWKGVWKGFNPWSKNLNSKVMKRFLPQTQKQKGISFWGGLSSLGHAVEPGGGPQKPRGTKVFCRLTNENPMPFFFQVRHP